MAVNSRYSLHAFYAHAEAVERGSSGDKEGVSVPAAETYIGRPPRVNFNMLDFLAG